jgi:mRNA interferase MazF
MTPACWSVWLANLDPVVGSEQGKTRPVLIISDTHLNQILPVVNVLPVTSRKPKRRVYPNEALMPAGSAGLTAESIILCHQIRTLDKQRLIKSFGSLDDASLRGDSRCPTLPTRPEIKSPPVD